MLTFTCNHRTTAEFQVSVGGTSFPWCRSRGIGEAKLTLRKGLGSSREVPSITSTLFSSQLGDPLCIVLNVSILDGIDFFARKSDRVGLIIRTMYSLDKNMLRTT